MKNKYPTSRAGFTLIEILLVIGIIAVLATVVIVALDPATRFKDARDSRRTSDVESIAGAIQQYLIDNKGVYPAGLNVDEERMLGLSNGGCASTNGGCNSSNDSCLDLSGELVRYLKSIPYDPLDGSEGTTQYTVVRDTSNIVTIKACSAEGGTISVSR